MTRPSVVFVLVVLCFLASPAVALPQQTTGVIEGTVTAQNGTITLGGVQVLVFSGDNRVANVLSEGDGKFKIENLTPGEYRVSGLLDGFQPFAGTASVAAGQTVNLSIDLQLAETVIVRGDVTTSVVPPTGTLSRGDAVTQEEVEQLSSGAGLPAALRLLVSVIEVPGGVAIKGGRPSQASMQLGPGLFVDPATGLTQGTLPDDAIDTITVLPNPYAVEFGRFSSGLVVVQTRRASDKWKLRLNSLDPAFRTRRGEPLSIAGVQSFYPRVQVGGPIIKGKLFIQSAAQYRYRANDVPSRPPDELRTSHRLSSLTRLDANLSSHHSLTAVGGTFPGTAKFATLGTFTPPDATIDLKTRVDTVAVTERTLWTGSVFSETTAEINRYRADVRPQGAQAMELLPETTEGNFFNRQNRMTSTYQFVQTLTGTHTGLFGLHQYKGGFDVLHSRFDGESQSRSVLIRRTDGSVARRLDFTPGGAQQIRSTDLALFAQDRVQPNSRWYIEFGGRIDRDGVIDRYNLTPRVGTAVLLNPSGAAVVRGGYGLFYERTPSAAGVFEQYENASETRYAADGVTALGPPQLFRHVTGPDLQTSRSATWDLAYDQRFNAHWALHLGGIDRRGTHELIVDPVTGPGGAELQLHSDGRSKYREIETSFHFTGGPGVDLNVSYVRSEARADLNAFTTFFDNVMAPVLGKNEYAPARADAPNRVLVRGRAMPAPTWLFVGVLDWRTGLPYSVVDESLDFAGPRNRDRFPDYFRLDLGIEHRFKIGKLRPWIGVRADNALNSFLPADVQANNSSPNFQDFYNSEYRQFRIQVRFER
jgi:hypothetical protein